MIPALILTIDGTIMTFDLKILESGHESKSIDFLVEYFKPLLESIFSLILACSAFYLMKLVKVTTGKKQNICLLICHVLNLLLLITFLVVSNIIYAKRLTLEVGSEDYYRYGYYGALTGLA